MDIQNTQFPIIKTDLTPSALIRLNSKESSEDPTKITMSSNTLPRNDVLFSRINRLAVSRIVIEDYLDNIITDYNDTILFQDTGGLLIATVPPGRYETIADLMDAIITAMNSVSTLTYNWSTRVNGDYVTLSNLTTTNFRIFPESNMIRNGSSTILLPNNNFFSNAKIVGPIKLLSTEFVEVHSRLINSYNTHSSYSNSSNRSSLVATIDLTDTRRKRIVYEPRHLHWVSVLETEGYTQVDFELIDDKGQYLKIPTNQDRLDSKQDFHWSVELLVEYIG